MTACTSVISLGEETTGCSLTHSVSDNAEKFISVVAKLVSLQEVNSCAL